MKDTSGNSTLAINRISYLTGNLVRAQSFVRRIHFYSENAAFSIQQTLRPHGNSELKQR